MLPTSALPMLPTAAPSVEPAAQPTVPDAPTGQFAALLAQTAENLAAAPAPIKDPTAAVAETAADGEALPESGKDLPDRPELVPQLAPASDPLLAGLALVALPIVAASQIAPLPPEARTDPAAISPSPPRSIMAPPSPRPAPARPQAEPPSSGQSAPAMAIPAAPTPEFSLPATALPTGQPMRVAATLRLLPDPEPDKVAAEVEAPAPIAQSTAPTPSFAVVTAPVMVSGHPASAAAPAAAQAPQDFTQLIDRLAAARESAQPQAATVALAHAEFGPVELRFRHESGSLSVALASADPDFSRAVQAAVQPVFTAADHSGPPPRHPGQGQSSGQFEAQSGQPQGHGFGQSAARRAPQDHFDGRDPAQPRTEGSRPEPGIFA